jgi:AcrR family transcriptional regulator
MAEHLREQADGRSRRRRGGGKNLSAAEMRESALIVGSELFGRKGYAATSTRELSAALGTTNGNFYHHFDTKEELLLQICVEALARITDASSRAIAGLADPVERLQTLIRAHVDAMLADRDLHRTMLVELRSLTGENLEKVKARRDLYESIVSDVIEDGQTAGVLVATADARTLTLVLLNMLNWTIFWWRDNGTLSPSAFADLVIETFLRGALDRPAAT